MTIQPLTILVVEGTVREGRNSIHPARYVTAQFQEKGHDAELFDMVEYDIPLFTNRRDATSDPHPDVDVFGQKVEAADAIVTVTPEYNHSIPGALKNLLDHLYPKYKDDSDTIGAGRSESTSPETLRVSGWRTRTSHSLTPVKAVLPVSTTVQVDAKHVVEAGSPEVVRKS